MIKPRLTSSKKPTDFPVDYIKMIREVIVKNFKKPAKENRVVVEGFIYPEEICVRIGFQTPSGIRQTNFEASVDYSIKKKDMMDQVNIAIDALGSMIDQYYKADGDIELPIKWHAFKLEGKTVHLQTSTENSNLEAAANKLLESLDEEE